LKLNIAGQTDKGLIRPNNEDDYFLDSKHGLLAVADGMGGHASGEIASKIAVDVLRDYFQKVSEGNAPLIGSCYDENYSDATNQLCSAIQLANTAIHEAAKSNPDLHGMGTTMAAILIQGKHLSIAHVGDSRIYLVRAGEIEQLTDDHTLVYEQVKRDLISKEEAEQSTIRHVLTRALGIAPFVDVDLDEMTLAEGDVLILCSDGLSGMISDQDILLTATSLDTPSVTCQALIDLANQNGGKDNITVVAGYLAKKRRFASVLKFFRWFRR
jgi:serine/threonine protein phosphatase PrpC